MNDEWVPVGALLGDEDLFYGCGIECVGTEAVDGFRGERHEAAVAEDLASTRDVGGSLCVEAFGLRWGCHCLDGSVGGLGPG